MSYLSLFLSEINKPNKQTNVLKKTLLGKLSLVSSVANTRQKNVVLKRFKVYQRDALIPAFSKRVKLKINKFSKFRLLK